jgi:Ni/Fe-hydrogenase 1 B-type cytochrome subunit
MVDFCARIKFSIDCCNSSNASSSLPAIFMIVSGLALYAEGLGMGHWLYNVTDFMLLFFDGTMAIHTYHHLGMWVIICFIMLHLYAAFREELVSRQSMISTMISGWRMFK